MVIRNGGLGDTLLLVPFFRRIRAEYPAGEVHGMGRKETLDLLVREGEIHAALAFDRDGIWCFFNREEHLPAGLANLFSSYDRIYSLVDDADGIFNENLKRASRGEVICASPFPPPRFPWHISRYYVDILGPGQEGANPRNEYSLLERPFAKREDDLSALAPYFREWGVDPQKDRLLALHPGSGSPYKNWPLKSFLETARICGERGWKILWLLGPAEEEREADFPGAGENIISVRLSLALLSSLLKYCGAYLGNDSGISHLAGWSGIPTVVLFGPSDPLLWKPLGPGVKILSRGLMCSPCPQEEWKNCPERRCLLGISVEEALFAADESRLNSCSFAKPFFSHKATKPQRK